MTYRITLDIPKLPRLQAANGRQHWRVRYNEEKWWKHQVGWHAKSAGLPEKPLRRARIVCTRRSTQEPDMDNLSASLKPAIDGLKGLVIEDDGPDYVKAEYHWEYAKRGHGGVKIEVEET